MTSCADGIRKIGSGADPQGIFKQTTYDRYSSTPDRTPPTYLLLGEEAEKSNEFTPVLSLDIARLALGTLRTYTTEDQSIGDEVYDNLDETKVPEKPRVPHSANVWACAHCDRYLFTPLNILHISNGHVEVELMEWMMELGQVTGVISCPKCNEVIGEYNWQPVKLDDGGYLPVFKIHKTHLKHTRVEFQAAEIK